MTDPTPPPAHPHRFTDDYTFEADFRGETLTYIESGRKADFIWTWTNGYRISVGSLTHWKEPDGSYTPIREDERATIVRRAVDYCRDVQHVKLIIDP